MPKPFIKFGLAGISILGLAILLYFIFRKTSSSQDSVITLTISGAGLSQNTETIQIPQNTIAQLTVGNFIGQVLQASKTVKISLQDISWKSVLINNHVIPILNGKITENALAQSLSNLVGGVRDINLTIIFGLSCSETNKSKLSCDPCKGQTYLCTDDGWICDESKCPTDLSMCCTSPESPIATCAVVNNLAQITCSSCPESTKPSCPSTDPCSLRGAVCTASGWVCQDKSTCPLDPKVLAQCCDSNKHALCMVSNGVASLSCSVNDCSKDTNPPTCLPDCSGSGLVCGIDGKWACQKGVLKPPDSILATCCPSSSPVSTWSDGKVICSGCGEYKGPPCNQDCQGSALVCGADGQWSCKPGQKCPSLDYIQQNCQPKCGSSQKAVCDPVSNCVKCNCPDGDFACANQNCISESGTPSQCSQTCCPNGTQCNTNIHGDCECCPTSQMCEKDGKYFCCPDGTVCQNGECVSICGFNKDGGVNVCNAGQTCVEIKNVDAMTMASLKKNYSDIAFNGDNAYVCLDNNSQCNFESGTPAVIPAGIDNYYPCYNFPVPSVIDAENPGPAYCVGKLDTDTQHCSSSYSTQNSCVKDGVCQWRNVMNYMADSSDQGMAQQKWQQIQQDMQIIQKNQEGNFCDPSTGTQSFQRIIAFPGGNACEAKDCWGRIAQPGVTNVVFNPKPIGGGTMCVALQQCGNSSLGISKTCPTPENPNATCSDNFTPSLSKYAGNFPNCNTPNITCPINEKGYSCDVKTGKIVHNTYDCVNDTDAGVGQKCVLNIFGTGKYGDANCDNSCSCGAGYQRQKTDGKVEGGCYQIPFGIGDHRAMDICNNQWSKCNEDGDGSKATSVCNSLGGTYTAHASKGTCGSSCVVFCKGPQNGQNGPTNIPKGYYSCNGSSVNDNGYNVSNASWGQCSTPGGCTDPGWATSWVANTNDGKFGPYNPDDNSYRTFCPMP